MQNSPQDLRKKILGRKGEDIACRYLKKNGYKILKRNYKTPFGVEVKTRETDAFGLPAEAVTRAKQRRYRQMANFWCAVLREEVPIRFDVASIFEGEIEYYENAFM